MNTNKNIDKINELLLNEFNSLVCCSANVYKEFGENIHIVHENDIGDDEIRYSVIGDLMIISRVYFNNKRNGIFTGIMNKLVENSRKFNIRKIVIQSVCTDEMYSWCKKNGYNEMGNGFGGDLRGDFVKEIYGI